MIKKGELLSYIYDEAGRRIGVVLATGKENIGWSLLHDEDSLFISSDSQCYKLFDKVKGIAIARSRAKTPIKSTIETLEKKLKTRVKTIDGSTPPQDIAVREFPKLFGLLYPALATMQERASKYYKE